MVKSSGSARSTPVNFIGSHPLASSFIHHLQAAIWQHIEPAFVIVGDIRWCGQAKPVEVAIRPYSGRPRSDCGGCSADFWSSAWASSEVSIVGVGVGDAISDSGMLVASGVGLMAVGCGESAGSVGTWVGSGWGLLEQANKIARRQAGSFFAALTSTFSELDKSQFYQLRPPASFLFCCFIQDELPAGITHPAVLDASIS